MANAVTWCLSHLTHKSVCVLLLDGSNVVLRPKHRSVSGGGEGVLLTTHTNRILLRVRVLLLARAPGSLGLPGGTLSFNR